MEAGRLYLQILDIASCNMRLDASDKPHESLPVPRASNTIV
jgi:hypothetical protein